MRNCNDMRKSSIDEAKQDTRWGGGRSVRRVDG